jgi:hypothetical protein
VADWLGPMGGGIEAEAEGNGAGKRPTPRALFLLESTIRPYVRTRGGGEERKRVDIGPPTPSGQRPLLTGLVKAAINE